MAIRRRRRAGVVQLVVAVGSDFGPHAARIRPRARGGLLDSSTHGQPEGSGGVRLVRRPSNHDGELLSAAHVQVLVAQRLLRVPEREGCQNLCKGVDAEGMLMDLGDDASKYLEQVTGGTAKDFSLTPMTGSEADIALVPLFHNVKVIAAHRFGRADNVEQWVDKAIALIGAHPAGDWTDMSEAAQRAFLARVNRAQWQAAGIADKPIIRLPPGISEMQQTAALMLRCA